MKSYKRFLLSALKSYTAYDIILMDFKIFCMDNGCCND